jgi:hypothetical protein
MEVSKRVFADDAFRKRYDESHSRRPVSKALFEGIAVAMARVGEAHGEDGLRRLVGRRKQVRMGFMDLMSDREFDRSISQGTGDPPRVRLRFLRLIELMEKFASPAGNPQ